MNKTMIKKEGIGSYFHYENPESFKNSKICFDFDYYLFFTGRHALLYILNEITRSNKISNIWFPNYYCQHTLNWIKKSYPNINSYKINPFDFSNDNIDILGFATNQDVVLINNYWGLSTMHREKSVNSPIIIEDHSHGWLSDASLNSKADYCFVSLRKSLPIPLGGMYWKPKHKAENKINDLKMDDGFYEIWDLMLEAMQLKLLYIHGDNDINNSAYLPLFYRVEDVLNNYFKFTKLTDKHKQYIESFLKINTRKIKENNLAVLYNNFEDNKLFKIIKRKGFTAFGFLLIFKDEEKFNSLKKYLLSKSIYPSSLWPDNHIEYEWRYFLNIHVDFRYNENDMHYIVSIIKEWVKHQTI